MKKPEDSDFFSKRQSSHKSKWVCVNKSIIYVKTHERKAPINKLSRNNTLKTQQVEVFAHLRKINDPFIRH